MRIVPRVALGAVQPQVDYRPVLWALLHQLDAAGHQVQSFFSQSRFVPSDGASPITGRAYRHLDSWLMDAGACREVFAHGVSGADVAVVDGQYGDAPGGSLDPLCRWLEMPRLAVIDPYSDDPCRLPARPESIDGALLINIADRGELARQRCRLEALWGVKVLGGLIACPHLTAILQRLPAGAKPSREVCRALGEALLLQQGVDAVTKLSPSPAWHQHAAMFAPAPRMAGMTVAVAFDDAFCHYFPDTLDLLELSGAYLRDFSPLADDGLPEGTDVVFLGSGHIHRHAGVLAENPCMIAALRAFARAGGRVYAEGSATAYLSCQLELNSGRRIPMAGLIPTIARQDPAPPPPAPVEITVQHDSWLACQGDRLRGYKNHSWRLEPLALIDSVAREPAHRFDIVRSANVIASNLHLNLVGQPQTLARFLSAPARAAQASRL